MLSRKQPSLHLRTEFISLPVGLCLGGIAENSVSALVYKLCMQCLRSLWRH